ncbi:MAG: signal peptidase I [Amphiamblys sp. WSBS2006]|nr:MAG: signal peptidase I [Amphiamblys sp. WSBS2006]
MLEFFLNLFGIGSIRRINKKQGVLQILNVFTMFTSAYMGWRLLGSVVNHYSPFVVVLSESMEPGFRRGDILFITMMSDPIECGDIVVFDTQKKQIPIVHRVMNVHAAKKTGKLFFLTKGDNNKGHDRPLYGGKKMWLHGENIQAKVKGYIPFLGNISLIIKEYPAVKTVLISTMCLLTLLTRE